MHDYRGMLAGWPGILQIHSVSVFSELSKMFGQRPGSLSVFSPYRYNLFRVLYATFDHL